MKISVKPLRWWEHLLNYLFVSIMYVAQGTFFEVAQITHRWNNLHLEIYFSKYLKVSEMVYCEGNKAETVRQTSLFWMALAHLPILGGWKNYVVIAPADENQGTWHAGWSNEEVCGVTRMVCNGPVRLLIGPGDVLFFGIDAATGEQIPLQEIARDTIGNRGHYSKTQLL